PKCVKRQSRQGQPHSEVWWGDRLNPACKPALDAAAGTAFGGNLKRNLGEQFMRRLYVRHALHECHCSRYIPRQLGACGTLPLMSFEFGALRLLKRSVNVVAK